jgi:transcription elongation factor Elf1
MSDTFDTFEIPIQCPDCGHEVVKTVAWINSHDSFDCAGCGAAIRLAPVHHISGTVEEPSDLAAEIQRQIDRANQKK